MHNRVEKHTNLLSVSTLDFEKYTVTTPVLSSREAGWEGIMARLYHEPAKADDITLPAARDIHLVLLTHGFMNIESRDVHGPWEAFRVRENELFLTPGDSEPYGLRWQSLSSDPIHALHIHLSAELFARVAEQVAGRDRANMLLKELTGFQDPLLTQMGLALQRELEQPTPAGQLYAETVAQMLAVHLLKHYSTPDIHVEHYAQGLTRQQMRQITDYILAHLDEKLSLEMLAQQAGFSAYHFSYLFRQTTGRTLHQFVLDRRIEQAQHLLSETNLPLSQVALTVGFQTQSHFTQVFKNHLGVTPRQYRQQS